MIALATQFFFDDAPTGSKSMPEVVNKTTNCASSIALAVALATLPTGAHASYANVEAARTSPKLFYYESRRVPAASQIITPSGKIAAIQRELSFSISDIAKLVGVERPTIYDWMGDDVQLRQANSDKLESLYNLSVRWSNASARPLGNLAKERIFDKQSLMDIALADADSISDGILSQLKAIQDKAQPKGIKRYLDEKGVVEVPAHLRNNLFHRPKV